MSTQPTSQHLTRALIAIFDWQQERKAREMEFHLHALTHNELHVVPGQEFTTRKANCDICKFPQKPGIRKFFYKENSVNSLHCWNVFVCNDCFHEMIASASLDALVLAQIPVAVTT